MKPKRATGVEARLREQGLAYPEVTEHFPWGHRVLKVRGKSFVFMSEGHDGKGFSVSVKLPSSGVAALVLPFAAPTGYGMGKSGWVTASFARGEPIPGELLAAWLEESYRAIAPRKLVAALDGAAPSARRPRAARKRRAS